MVGAAAPAGRFGPLSRARRALLAGLVGLLAMSGPGLVSQEPPNVPPPRRRPVGYRKLPFEDRQDERRQSEIGWMGGQPSPAHQEYKKQLAATHLERFAASFPRPQGGAERAALSQGSAELPMIQGPSTVSWRCLGPTKGVSTYSGINNTAMLIEIARQKGNYVPDLSFGTHFFQDLVEARIRYLPLYPDEEGNLFNEAFFRDSPGILAELLPDFGHLEPVIRVIDLERIKAGTTLEVAMDGDKERALGFLREGK